MYITQISLYAAEKRRTLHIIRKSASSFALFQQIYPRKIKAPHINWRAENKLFTLIPFIRILLYFHIFIQFHIFNGFYIFIPVIKRFFSGDKFITHFGDIFLNI